MTIDVFSDAERGAAIQFVEDERAENLRRNNDRPIGKLPFGIHAIIGLWGSGKTQVGSHYSNLYHRKGFKVYSTPSSGLYFGEPLDIGEDPEKFYNFADKLDHCVIFIDELGTLMERLGFQSPLQRAFEQGLAAIRKKNILFIYTAQHETQVTTKVAALTTSFDNPRQQTWIPVRRNGRRRRVSPSARRAGMAGEDGYERVYVRGRHAFCKRAVDVAWGEACMTPQRWFGLDQTVFNKPPMRPSTAEIFMEYEAMELAAKVYDTDSDVAVGLSWAPDTGKFKKAVGKAAAERSTATFEGLKDRRSALIVPEGGTES